MQTTPYFELEVVIANSPGAIQVSLEVRADSPEAAHKIAVIGEAFVAAANFGMFSPTTLDRTLIVAQASDAVIQGVNVRFQWTMSGVHVAAYRVLIRMLNTEATSVQSARLTSPPFSGPILTQGEVLNSHLPAPNPPAFQVTGYRSLNDCREPLIRVVFANALSDDDLTWISPQFSAWDSVVLRGGFLEHQEDLAGIDLPIALDSAQTYRASPNAIEHVLYDFAGSSEAFNAIVNMLTRMHRQDRGVVLLELE